MDWTAVRWRIPLLKPPLVTYLGAGVFGKHPVRRFHLPELWCLHIYRYRAELVIDERVFPIRSGYASITPPGAELEYRFRERSVHLAAHFKFPLASKRAECVEIPAMQDLGSEFTKLYDAMEEGVGYFPSRPERTVSRIWDILWRLTGQQRSGDAREARPESRNHPALVRAQQIIEQKLEATLAVAELAKEVGLSHNHLTRLFRGALGKTVQAYIRARRSVRARHLLLNSNLPIKVIATEVGLPDLHQFNKTIRRELGHSPRGIRERNEVILDR